jgi:hypothetical protein
LLNHFLFFAMLFCCSYLWNRMSLSQIQSELGAAACNSTPKTLACTYLHYLTNSHMKPRTKAPCGYSTCRIVLIDSGQLPRQMSRLYPWRITLNMSSSDDTRQNKMQWPKRKHHSTRPHAPMSMEKCAHIDLSKKWAGKSPITPMLDHSMHINARVSQFQIL